MYLMCAFYTIPYLKLGNHIFLCFFFKFLSGCVAGYFTLGWLLGLILNKVTVIMRWQYFKKRRGSTL